MKTIKNITILILLLFAFNACMDEHMEEFTANKPVYLSYEKLRSAVKSVEVKELVNSGKIYFKDGYIFINEQLKGVHIIDNRNPKSPKNIGFIEIPGNIDIAIKNDILYADSYIDLIGIDISDINNPVEVKRVQKVLPYTLPKHNEKYRIAKIDENKGVVVGWELTKVKEEIEYNYYPYYYQQLENRFDYTAKATTGSGSVIGIGGAMARLGFHDKYLYAVDNFKVHIFDVEEPSKLNKLVSQHIGGGTETMFIYDAHMFLGTQTGMRVYNLAVPTSPSYVGQFRHVKSCDPVVVADGYAYVTLRGGTECGSTVNSLDVLKLAGDYKNNIKVGSYPLEGPYGLGIDDDILFVCDGNAGLKIYNVNDKTQIAGHMISSFPNINAYDVIPMNDYLFMIGDDGFYQYDYSDIQNIKEISHIPVKKDS